MKLTTKEELFLEMMRSFEPEQQADLMGRFLADMRAQIDANRAARKANLGIGLKVVGNRRIEETYGLPKKRQPIAKLLTKKRVTKRPQRKDDDDLDPGMDDAMG